MKIWQWILRLFSWLAYRTTPADAPPNISPPNVVPKEPNPPQVDSKLPEIVPKYDWSTPTAARHSVRLICDEEGLTVEQKNTMCATIGGESGWSIRAINPNYYRDKNGEFYLDNNGKKILASTDWGICQWNDYYHGKEISPTEAMDNPEKAVRLMCAYWKRGQRTLWIAYKSGRYKSFYDAPSQ